MYSKILPVSALACMALINVNPAIATTEGDWLVRARIINIDPHSSSGEVTGIAGSGVDVDSKVTLDIDITKMIKANFGVELLLDLSSVHDINGTGAIAGLGKVAEARVLPPALIAQYHFMPNNNIRPYAGAGINYTMFFGEKTTSSLDGAMGSTSIKLDDSFGLVAQVGADIDINNEWFANVDLKYIKLSTTATLNSSGTVRAVDVDLNPLVFGVGIGKRF